MKSDHPSNNQSIEGAPTFYSIKAQTSYSIQSRSVGPYGKSTEYPQLVQPSTSSHPPPTSNNYSWNDAGGVQPPLTSSKRDQNWEKKRRLWLTRKNAGEQMKDLGGVNQPSMPPPAAMSWVGSCYNDNLDGSSYNSPSSPLTKFVAQQNLKQYDPTPTGSGTGMRPPSSVPNSYVAPRTASTSGMYSSHGRGNSNNGPPPPTAGISPSTAVAGNDVYSSHGRGYSSYGPPPGSSSSASSSNWSRQPPGGQSQWSPYS